MNRTFKISVQRTPLHLYLNFQLCEIINDKFHIAENIHLQSIREVEDFPELLLRLSIDEAQNLADQLYDAGIRSLGRN